MLIPAEDRAAYWRGYLRVLADKMELRDWSVDFADEAPFDSDDAEAQSHCGYGRKTMTVRVSRGFQDHAPERQRASMVHELLHCHTTRTFQLMKTALGEVNKQWFQALDCAVTMDLEYAIDAIADGWAKTLPLPPEYRPGWDWRVNPAGPEPKPKKAKAI